MIIIVLINKLLKPPSSVLNYSILTNCFSCKIDFTIFEITNYKYRFFLTINLSQILLSFLLVFDIFLKHMFDVCRIDIIEYISYTLAETSRTSFSYTVIYTVVIAPRAFKIVSIDPLK